MKSMDRYELTRGEGRVRVSLWAQEVGEDLVVCIFNENAHIGAVAVGEYDHNEKRASTSVITRPGHKDDVIARKAAHLLSKHTRKSSCAIAGVHVDDITEEETQKLLENTDSLVGDFVKRWGQHGL